MRRLFQKNPINIKFELYYFRKYGQPKLKKPKELKGIKQSFSVDYIPKKCKCQVFILNNDVYVKHGDYFSSEMELKDEDLGAPLDVLTKKYLDKDKNKKFAYGDAWGSVIKRQEAWIKISNLIREIKLNKFELDISKEIRTQQERLHNFEYCDLCCTDMERFGRIL